MTLDQYNFLVDINLEFVKQAEIHRHRVSISSQQSMLDRYIFLLIRCYVKILNDYFAPFLSTDANFMTEEEAQLVLDRFNLLCNTDYLIDFDLTDVVHPGPSSPWDDSETWVDDDEWVD